MNNKEIEDGTINSLCCDRFKYAFNSQYSPLKYSAETKVYSSCDDWDFYVCPFCGTTLDPKLTKCKLELEANGNCTLSDGTTVFLEDKVVLKQKDWWIKLGIYFQSNKKTDLTGNSKFCCREIMDCFVFEDSWLKQINGQTFLRIAWPFRQGLEKF